MRSPSRNFWLRGSLSSVGISQTMKWNIASSAGPDLRTASLGRRGSSPGREAIMW
jgi:hypothetical protein